MCERRTEPGIGIHWRRKTIRSSGWALQGRKQDSIQSGDTRAEVAHSQRVVRAGSTAEELEQGPARRLDGREAIVHAMSQRYSTALRKSRERTRAHHRYGASRTWSSNSVQRIYRAIFLNEKRAGCESKSKVPRRGHRAEEKERKQEGYIQGTIRIRQQKTPCVTKGFLAPRAGLEPIAIPRIGSNLADLLISKFYEFHNFHELHYQGYN